MKVEHFVSFAGEKKGPFGVAELRRRFEQGEFPGGSLFWREGWAEWRKLNELSEDALIEMLVTAEDGAPALHTKPGRRRLCTWEALAVSGPLAQYIRRISPGYAVVPRQLKLEGVFRLEHPDVGPARQYHEDGRRAVEEP